MNEKKNAVWAADGHLVDSLDGRHLNEHMFMWYKFHLISFSNAWDKLNFIMTTYIDIN